MRKAYKIIHLFPGTQERVFSEGSRENKFISCNERVSLDFDGIVFGDEESFSRCVEECDKTECAGYVNPRTGCNQMYSCAHACKIRDLGVAGNHCREMCQRNGQSGCSPTVRGWQFDLCRDCNRAGCSTYPSIGECVRGCDIYIRI